MLRRKIIVLIAFGVVAAAFALQSFQVFMLRVEIGDLYPAYSSYRSDPLGARALYEALYAVPGLELSRNTADLEDIGLGANRTLIFAGATRSKDPKRLIEAIDAFVATGGRLVIAFKAEYEDPYPDPTYWAEEDDLQDEDLEETTENAEEEERELDGEEVEEEEEEEEEEEDALTIDISEQWGFDYEFLVARLGEDGEHLRAQKVDGQAETLPDEIAWWSKLYFKDLEEAWTAVYTVDDHPVVIERDRGAGSIALCGDSYFLSNEAMRQDRRSAFISWIVGPNYKVVFDETHLGVMKQEHVMTLARRYRLHAMMAVLLLMAILFVWRNASSLVPRREQSEEDQDLAEALGKDSAAGLTNLLRRSIPLPQLLDVCLNEWRTACAARLPGRAGRVLRAERERAVEAIIGHGAPARHRSRTELDTTVAKRYQEVCRMLREKDLI